MDDRDELIRRLHDGDWLTVGEIGVALKVGRTKARVLVYGTPKKPPVIRSRNKPASDHRTGNPDDVLALLPENQPVHGAPPAGGDPPPAAQRRTG